MMFYSDPWSPFTSEELMLGYDAAGAEREWAELLLHEARLRTEFYQAQGMDREDALQRSGLDLAEHRATKARREVDQWWQLIRPRVLITDGGSL
jgi:hypothetical protein